MICAAFLESRLLAGSSAIGLASGFIEPLEFTAIRLIESAVGGLIQYFPDMGFNPKLADEFNRLSARQYESVREFVLMYYKLTKREDSLFWKACAEVPLSNTIAHQTDVFRTSGRVVVLDPDGFTEPSWVSLFLGLELIPESYDPFIDPIDIIQLRGHFARIKQLIFRMADATPLHKDYIARHYDSEAPATTSA